MKRVMRQERNAQALLQSRKEEDWRRSGTTPGCCLSRRTLLGGPAGLAKCQFRIASWTHKKSKLWSKVSQRISPSYKNFVLTH